MLAVEVLWLVVERGLVLLAMPGVELADEDLDEVSRAGAVAVEASPLSWGRALV